MSTPNNKLKYVFDRALPSFAKEDNPGFVAFLEAYYEFLQQSKAVTDVRSLRDIDSTLDDFVTYFKSELGANIPFSDVNEKFLVTRVRDLYLSKGTAASFKLLFRILYGKEVVIEYPGRQMLRASDGRWIQDYSVFIEVKAGDPNDIIGKIVDVVTPSKTISLNVLNKQDVELEVNNVIQKSDKVFELFIDRRFFGTFSAGDKIVYKDFIGIVQQSSANLRIRNGGAGFRAGQLFSISTPKSTPSIIKVKSVSSTGAITAVEFVKFGFGFLTDFNVRLFPTPVNLKTPTGITINGQAIDIGDEVEGFVDYGYLNKVDYVEIGAWDDTYVGDILREFVDISYREAEETEDSAIIEIFLGAVAKYPGYFSDNSGFLSDAIYIQDSVYYQQFSYLIKIDEALESYKSFVKSLLHPAGTAIFGEYALQNEFDLSTDIESLLLILFAKLLDSVEATDEYGLDVGKNFTEETTLSDTDSTSLKVFGKLATPEAIVASDDDSFHMEKRLDDSATITDSDPVLKDISSSTSDNTSTSDENTMSIEKGLTEDQTIADDPALLFTTSFSESPLLATDDQPGLAIEKSFADSVTTSDSVPALTTGLDKTDEVTSSDLVNAISSALGVEDTANITESDFYYSGSRGFVESTDAVTDSVGAEVSKLIEDFTEPVTDAISDISPFFGIEDNSTEPTDSVNNILISKSVTEEALPEDAAFIQLNRTVDPDSVTSADAGGFVEFNPYNDADFFGENYSGTRIPF